VENDGDIHAQPHRHPRPRRLQLRSLPQPGRLRRRRPGGGRRQGIQAQTLANVYLAIEAGLEIIPVLNKIDLPAADPERVAAEVSACSAATPTPSCASPAKPAKGVTECSTHIVTESPPPRGPREPLRALIFDSIYDVHRGVILFVRIVDGAAKRHDDLTPHGHRAPRAWPSNRHLRPQANPGPKSPPAKSATSSPTSKTSPKPASATPSPLAPAEAPRPSPATKPSNPSSSPASSPAPASNTPTSKTPSKSSSSTTPPSSTSPNPPVLGFGYRVGFLGLLHLEIIKERLEREYGLDMVVTSPSTDYIVTETDGTERTIRSAAELPDQPHRIEHPRALDPRRSRRARPYVGGVIQLINRIRGLQKTSPTSTKARPHRLRSPARQRPHRLLRLAQIHHQRLRQLQLRARRLPPRNLVRLDILVGGEIIDSLSMIVTHRDEALPRRPQIVEKLKEIIPKQTFEVTLQAAIGGKIIAREDVKALRKDVTAKLYGGDVTRKNKLLDKQKRGKKRMKRIGKVDIPAEAFMVLVSKDS
jgi:GTP-binding protein LepA